MLRKLIPRGQVHSTLLTWRRPGQQTDQLASTTNFLCLKAVHPSGRRQGLLKKLLCGTGCRTLKTEEAPKQRKTLITPALY
jgi:hypothetical protein